MKRKHIIEQLAAERKTKREWVQEAKKRHVLHYLPDDTQNRVGNIVRLHWQSSLDELKDWVRAYGPDILRTDTPAFGVVPGFEHDPRPLWEIPEVLDLFGAWKTQV